MLISDETLPVAPAAASNCDADPVWCETLTVGHLLEEALGEVYVSASGFESRPGRDAYGSVTDTAFSHLGVDYAVAALFGGAGTPQGLYFATTPPLPDDGAGLTVHVQTYGGEVSAPLAEGVFQDGEYWYFEGKVHVDASGSLSDVPLLRGPFNSGALIEQPPDLGTAAAVRLSYANRAATGAPTISGTTRPGQTLTASTSGIADADGNTNAEDGEAGYAYTYQWIRVDSDGSSNATDISGATGSTYVLTTADVGKSVKVEVEFTDDADNDEGPLPSGAYPTGGTIAEVSVRFGSSTYTAAEGGAAATVTVELSGAAGSSVTILLTRVGVGGADGDDYSGVPPSVTFGASETRNMFTVTATDDADADDGESVSIGFGTLPAGITPGSQATTTVVLQDNDTATRTVRFGSSTYTAAEGGAAATVTVELSGAAGSSVTIPLTPRPRGGADGDDYSGVPPSVTFGASETRKMFTVTATDDADADDGESVRIRFGTLPAGIAAGSPATTTVVLADDDGPGSLTVSFGADFYKTREGSEPATVTVELSQAAGSSVTIPLTRENRNFAIDADYSGVPPSVTFGPSETVQTFTVTAESDDDVDFAEEVKIGFGPLPPNVVLGNPSTTSVALEDDFSVSFGAATYTATEGGEGVTVTVRLTVAAGWSFTVPLTHSYQGGASSNDHSQVPTSIVFREYDKTKSFTVIAPEDGVDEDGESLVIGIGSSLPHGLWKGSPSTTTVELVDNDGSEPLSAMDAHVEGARLTLSYNAALDGGSVPSGGDFVVLAGPPGDETVIPVWGVAVAGDAVTLTLAQPVPSEDQVRLSYLVAPMHPVQDVSGRPAAALRDLAVRNETVPPPTDGADAAASLVEAIALAGPAVLERAAHRSAVDPSAWLADGGSSVPFRRLDLSSRAVADVSALANLTELRELNLSGNRIVDVSALAGLTDLRVLNLGNNAVADLGPLAGLTGLASLNLSGNRIADVSALAGLTDLRVLDLGNNAVADVGLLAGLTGLERLDLSGNRIADVSALSGLTGLEVLLLGGNRIDNLAALWSLRELVHLELSDNRIGDIGLLAELRSLQRLGLTGNRVSDVYPLGDLSRLVWLGLQGNPLMDTAPLGRLTLLRWLWLDAGIGVRGLNDSPRRGPAVPLVIETGRAGVGKR